MGSPEIGIAHFKKREKCKSPIRFSLQWLWRTVIMGIKENDKFEFERRHNYERISTSNR